MIKRRITLIADDPYVTAGAQVVWRDRLATVESVEDIPEPGRVHEFRIRVVARPCDVPVTADRIARLLSASISWPSNYAVTEVVPDPDLQRLLDEEAEIERRARGQQ